MANLPGSIKNLNTLLGEQLLDGGGSGGGGETWNTVFEGNVTTVSDDPAPITTIENVSLNADTIKVTFNGTEYECNKNADGSYGAMLDESTEEFDWSTYPFSVAPLIVSNPRVDIYTQTAGTYTLKIEEPSSGGESDFSTAEVTVASSGTGILHLPLVIDEDGFSSIITSFSYDEGEQILTAVLYKGSCLGNIDGSPTVTVTGDIEYDLGDLTITGDGTITIS